MQVRLMAADQNEHALFLGLVDDALNVREQLRKALNSSKTQPSGRFARKPLGSVSTAMRKSGSSSE